MFEKNQSHMHYQAFHSKWSNLYILKYYIINEATNETNYLHIHSQAFHNQ